MDEAISRDPSSLPARIAAKILVDQETGCWLWTGATDGSGYGRAYWQGQRPRAHRLTYELLLSPVPDGLVLDHLCRNRACVNPAHLEPVTHAENCRRAGITQRQFSDAERRRRRNDWARKHNRERYQSDPEYRRRVLEWQRDWNRDPEVLRRRRARYARKPRRPGPGQASMF